MSAKISKKKHISGRASGVFFRKASRRYSRSEKPKYIWFFSRLYVPLPSAKVLTLGKAQIYLVFLSLTRTFAGGKGKKVKGCQKNTLN